MSDDLQGVTGSMVMRINQEMTEGQSSVIRVYPTFNSQCKLLCKAGGAVILIVATVLALGVGGRMTTVHTPATHRTVGPSQQCAKKYAELFDLAHLARRNEKTSDVMVRELTVMSGRLNECLLTAAAHVQVAGPDFSITPDTRASNSSQS